MEDRAGGDGCLASAGGAFVGEWLGVERPGFAALAFWADEAAGPALFKEEFCAGRIVGKPRGEGGARHRAVVFPTACHRTNVEHSTPLSRQFDYP